MTTGFDPTHPPEQTLIDACVHCGFCLSTCPSYRVLGTEMDSPRGRIYQMAAINTGEIDLNPTTVEHFDSCLGCLACVTTCPSGVQYDKLIAATRGQVARNHARGPAEQAVRTLLFTLFPYPERLRALLAPLWLYQKMGLAKLAEPILKRLNPSLAAMANLLPPIQPQQLRRQAYPQVIPAQGPRRARVGMILGCVQRLFFDPVNAATVRVLTANGCEVVIPPDQGCCAALPYHQGETQQGETLARQMIDSFARPQVGPLDAVVINAAGCGHTLKEYGHILADDPAYRERAVAFAAQVKDVHEWLAGLGLVTPLHPLQAAPLAIVYQDACHLLHGQQISVQPRQLLRHIPGVTLKEPLDAALCCGSAGVYNMLQPEIAADLGQQKVANLRATGATVIASPNPGCALQIQKHLGPEPLPVLHPIEMLDRSIRNVGLT